MDDRDGRKLELWSEKRDNLDEILLMREYGSLKCIDICLFELEAILIREK